MVGVLSTALIADLEFLQRNSRLLAQTRGTLEFELDLANTTRIMRLAYLPQPQNLTAPLPFNASCLGGYCFFGEYQHMDDGTVDCIYTNPSIPIADDEDLWRDPDKHRIYSNGDYRYRVISELLCFKLSDGLYTPLYRTSMRVEWLWHGRTHQRLEVEFVHSDRQQYDWYERVVDEHQSF